MDVRFRYRVQLLNVTTFMGVAAFLAALEAAVEEPFLAYSIDGGGPTSEYSQHWELEFTTTACPKALQDVHRVFWVEHVVLVHHVNTHKQPPCLKCGSSMHFERACKTDSHDMRTKNCIVFDRHEAAKRAKTPATFASIDDMKAAFVLPVNATSKDKNDKATEDSKAAGGDGQCETEPGRHPSHGEDAAAADQTADNSGTSKKKKKRSKTSKNRQHRSAEPGSKDNPIALGSEEDGDCSDTERE